MVTYYVTHVTNIITNTTFFVHIFHVCISSFAYVSFLNGHFFTSLLISAYLHFLCCPCYVYSFVF